MDFQQVFLPISFFPLIFPHSHIDGKKVTSRIALWSGVFSYVSLLLGCFIILFIIEAQKEASENREWAINFAIAFVQDLSLSPAITTATTVFFIKLFEKEKFAKAISPKIQGALLSESFKAIYVNFSLLRISLISFLVYHFRGHTSCSCKTRQFYPKNFYFQPNINQQKAPQIQLDGYRSSFFEESNLLASTI